MYGSYPEISISMRFLYAKIQRIQNFLTKQPKKNWPLNYEQIIDIAKSVQNEG